MQMKPFLVFATIALWFSPFVPATVGATSRDESLINIRHALGIENLVNLDDGLTLTGQVEYFGTTGEYEYTFDATGRNLEHLDGPMTLTLGFDGETAWERDWNGTGRVLELGDRDRMIMVTWLSNGLWSLEPEGLLFTSYHEEPGRVVFGVSIEHGHIDGTVTVNSKTWLPESFKIRKEPTGTEATLADYGVFEGVQVPRFVKTIQSDGEEAVVTIRCGNPQPVQDDIFPPTCQCRRLRLRR